MPQNICGDNDKKFQKRVAISSIVDMTVQVRVDRMRAWDGIYDVDSHVLKMEQQDNMSE